MALKHDCGALGHSDSGLAQSVNGDGDVGIGDRTSKGKRFAVIFDLNPARVCSEGNALVVDNKLPDSQKVWTLQGHVEENVPQSCTDDDPFSFPFEIPLTPSLPNLVV